MPIKLMLTLGLAAVLAYATVQRVAPRIVKTSIVAFGLVGLYFVWLPDHATVIANWLGVGRGTDLLIYVWIVLSFAVGLNLNFKVRAARREITELTRAIALATAREQPDERVEPVARGESSEALEGGRE
jgi:small membrane protein